jgi:hypothetical protein
MSTGALVVDQPSDTEWIRFTVVPGSTFNDTIGTATTKLKRALFNVRVSIFVPRSQVFADAQTLTDSLDAAMIFEPIVTVDGGCIQMDEVEPKLTDIFYAANGEIWNQVEVTYQYLYRYV